MKGTVTILKADGSVSIRYVTAPLALEELQAAVGGYIETVPYFDKYGPHDCVAFCNEEGKLNNLPLNEQATQAWQEAVGQPLGDVLVGDIIILSGDKEFLKSL